MDVHAIPAHDELPPAARERLRLMADDDRTIVDPTGVRRRLGNFPSPPGLVTASRFAGQPPLDRKLWREFEHSGPDIPVIKNQGSYGACFPAGTRILVPDGTEKPIESVRVGEVVCTAEGNIGRVLRTMVRDHTSGVYRIRLRDHSRLTPTAEHPILTERGYVPSAELVPGDKVAFWYVSGGPSGYATSPVRAVEREEFSGPVHNLEVEGDNSYVAEGVGVHNCNGHAAATSLEWAIWIARTGKLVELSPWFVYAILCNGWDTGSSISEALDLLSKTGTCPFADVPYGTINPRRLSDAARKDAARFRVELATKPTTWDEVMSEAQLGRVMNLSVRVGWSFNRLSAEGVVGVDMGPGNHAITAGIGAKKLKDGSWAIKCQNSWGSDWGQRGYFWIVEGHVARQSWFDAYSVVAAIDDPEATDRPPHLVAALGEGSR